MFLLMTYSLSVSGTLIIIKTTTNYYSNIILIVAQSLCTLERSSRSTCRSYIATVLNPLYLVAPPLYYVGRNPNLANASEFIHHSNWKLFSQSINILGSIKGMSGILYFCSHKSRMYGSSPFTLLTTYDWMLIITYLVAWHSLL
jgi:hypothetical protein